MTIFLKNALITDKNSPFNGKLANIYIENGIISYIGNEEKNAEKVVDINHNKISPGWLDMRCFVGEPGFEHREDLHSVSKAAIKGGFTEIVALPNTNPTIQTKESVSFIKEKSKTLPITIHVCAAATIECKGVDISEMIDLDMAGTIAFTDANKPISNPDVLQRCLQYAQYFDGLIINKPEELFLTAKGRMNEGEISTQLGMKGMPKVAEELMISRDLQLLEYVGGKLHFTLVSSPKALEMIEEGKKKGLDITCDIASYQLAFTDVDMVTFDTHLKVNPPFRTEEDNEQIKKYLKNGTIDIVVSDHRPQDIESKEVEFEIASVGIINLETCYSIINTYSGLSTIEILDKMVYNPKKRLQLIQNVIDVNQPANITLFDDNLEYTFTETEIKSKSKNTPMLGKKLKGKVIGIVNKGNLYLN